MRKSLRESVKYLMDQSVNNKCPECGRVSSFIIEEMAGPDGNSWDMIECPNCKFKWEMAYRIILSPIMPN